MGFGKDFRKTFHIFLILEEIAGFFCEIRIYETVWVAHFLLRRDCILRIVFAGLGVLHPRMNLSRKNLFLEMYFAGKISERICKWASPGEGSTFADWEFSVLWSAFVCKEKILFADIACGRKYAETF